MDAKNNVYVTGWCIPLTWRCDGEYDCGGGHIELTEAQAEAAVEAGEAVTRRASDGAATVLRGDLSDEDAGMCADASVTCPSRGAFRCRTHARCIPNRWVGSPALYPFSHLNVGTVQYYMYM